MAQEQATKESDDGATVSSTILNILIDQYGLKNERLVESEVIGCTLERHGGQDSPSRVD